ncbi:Pantothenate kinase [Peribacillus sp. Bi96]|uniref:type I pantothenate kinase n=1 Tax=unclassified Peribacillus TaxID=2675266 RepID=UPI001E0787B6|nr:type I pantothenate kinase [Peribacillus sp. Bi96]CAH0164139.1 Pantothenate kinase [Peribacillus sp. Bi96]
MSSYTPYFEFNRKEWASLRNHAPLPLTEEELENVKGINVEISIDEVEEIYLPLTRLINLYVKASQQLHTATTSFLKNNAKKVPYIIGIAGSVAVGKSTTARILQILLSRWDNHRNVGLVTTDGFLYSNDFLEKKGLMKRKGFPESYDTQKLINFIGDVKAGKDKVEAPIYSHLTYDILPDEVQTICNPDILIVEGVNVLQVDKESQIFVSDFFDFSLYVDAEVQDIERWYIERFLLLQETAFQDTKSYFCRFANLSKEDAIKLATQIWEEINLVNLLENILPTKGRANIVLKKGSNHNVENIFLRKL